jgi:hypothetical protein
VLWLGEAGAWDDLALDFPAVLALFSARAAFAVHVPLPAAPAPNRPVVFVNPRSGGGKAERASLPEQARARGIDPVGLGPGDDLEQLARAAVEHGARGVMTPHWIEDEHGEKEEIGGWMWGVTIALSIALAIGFGAAGMLTFAYGFLENAGFFSVGGVVQRERQCQGEQAPDPQAKHYHPGQGCPRGRQRDDPHGAET